MKKLTPVKQYLLGFTLVFIALLIAIVAVFYSALSPRWQAEKEAQALAKEFAELKTITSVDVYNGKQAYYSVFGSSSKDEKEVVVISKEDQEIFVFEESEGISRKQAEKVAKSSGAKGISKVVFGLSNQEPIWEVTADNGFYLISFETGELIKKEGL